MNRKRVALLLMWVGLASTFAAVIFVIVGILKSDDNLYGRSLWWLLAGVGVAIVGMIVGARTERSRAEL
jgi:hypothetical protein